MRNKLKMSSVSLRKAYQACLWLAERELGVPDESRQGVWDLADNAELIMDRRAVIEELGEGHFLNTLYHLVNLSLIDLSNSIDGPISFSQGELLEESRFVVGGPHPITKADDVDRQLADEIDSLLYQSAIEDSALERVGVIESKEAVKGNQVTEERRSDDLSESEIASLMAGLKKVAKEVSTGKRQIRPDTQKAKAPTHITAQITAHQMLLELLIKGQIKATGYEVIESNALQCLTDKKELNTSLNITSRFWADNPFPHYAFSALHHGPGQNSYFQKRCEDKGLKYDPEMISRKEYWLSNIEVDQRFVDWYMPTLREVFPMPTAATLKPQGDKYLIQFGTDPERLVKANDGLKYIRQIIRSATVRRVDSQEGIQPGIIKTLEAFDNISEEQKKDLQKEYTKAKDDVARDRFIRKQKQQLYHQIKLYIAHKFHPESLKNKSYTLEQTERYLLKKANALSALSTPLESDHSHTVKQIVEATDFEETPTEEELKEEFARNLNQEEKDLFNYQRKIQDNLKAIKLQCPHFCYHIGAVHKGLQYGLVLTNTGFVYCPGEKIRWDLG